MIRGLVLLALASMAGPGLAVADAPLTPAYDLTGNEHGGFDRVAQMARRPDGRIYIADAYHHRVVVYREDGRLQSAPFSGTRRLVVVN